jgi:thiol-disulfide isomerase/thioredoxin
MQRFVALAALIALGTVAACSTQPAQPPKPAGKVEILPAAEGDVAKLVQTELGRARHDGKQLLVYVGATWCEPCRRFHKAAAEGTLNASLPTLRLLEFDADRDNERLAFAGYFSQFIPLFALPKPDGHASGKQVEGSVKGDGAVTQIVPKLRTLLAP